MLLYVLSINIALAQLIVAFIFGRLKMILLVLLLLASAVTGKRKSSFTQSPFVFPMLLLSIVIE